MLRVEIPDGVKALWLRVGLSAMNLAASTAKDRSGRRPPDFRHVAIGRAVRDDMPKRREVKVDAGDAQFLSGNELEHLLSRFRAAAGSMS
jgi:hypothetical protein